MISGNTRFVPLLAHPCRHVRTPPLFNAECERQGLDMIMVPLDVRPDMLQQTVFSLRAVENVAGMVITIPHKGSVSALCDRRVGAAELVGACNVIRREADSTLTGGMLDGEGFVAGLRHEGHEPAGRRTLLVGAGGAASGVAHALLQAGVVDLTIANRSSEKAEYLARQLAVSFPHARVVVGSAHPGGYDLIVNGTALGMHEGDPLPVDPVGLDKGSVVAEVVMQPDMTPLLIAAEASGCRVHRGIHMIEQQVQLLVDFLR
ncbi:shikimate dehydrogenase (plasmid) [Ensifer adhaerens]|uniref:shikimate dehydrogenase family protein n=1 Tax=Ensifer adhaerens TaxID=106592 RepID=UPI0023A9617D|nr:shikimate dehydrogenase [Ensifer adhaerens]WDZ79100.1 shikimate dehydrogenase [Ensifer adhaerens]